MSGTVNAVAVKKIDAFWFAFRDRLPHGDGRLIVIGESHSVVGDIVFCSNALHASRDPFDALNYAPGPYLYRVRCWGDIIEDNDKLGARHREYAAMQDATDMLRQFAREQALSVIHLWEAPDVVRQYLESGDERLRAAAARAAWVSWSAKASRAAKAAWAAAAAWDAWQIAKAAKDDAAKAAVWDAAASAASAAARKRFRELVSDLFSASHRG